MKKVVISGSSKLRDKINYWLDYFENNNYYILDYPREIDEDKFMEIYPDVHREFFENVTNTDILFVMNEDKNNIKGYIGAESFAELTFGLMQNLVYKKNIDLVVYQMPSKNVSCYEEIKLWLELGWIRLFEE